ncbi:MAG: NnrU protein [bacterium]|nr:NnrU protein [bacterium]
MTELWCSIIVFTLFHAVPSTSLRAAAITRFGRTVFLSAYSVISLVMFAWLFIAFWRAEHSGAYFVTSFGVRALSAVLLLAAFWLFSAALIRKPPILLTAETVLCEQGSIFGVLRITRHPFLWALVLWASVHIVNNADPAGLALFGYFLTLALLGTWPIDKRRARLIGDECWREILRDTSNLPFAAIFSGRQSLFSAIKEIGWMVPIVAIAAWAFVLTFHETFFGLPVFY